MKPINLSEWALKHPQMVLFLLLLLSVAGVLAYTRLGQKEDPEFTVKAMLVQAHWPGSSAQQMAEQVTDKLEKKLQEVAEVDYMTSYAKPGVTQITISLREDTAPAAVPQVWYQVRKKLGDIQHTLPQGVKGPFFNDEFGDTFGNLYAATASRTPTCATSPTPRATSSCAWPTSTRSSSSARRTRRSTSRPAMPSWRLWASTRS
jgi:multidrug efflux pump